MKGVTAVSTFKLEILTPQKQFFLGEVEAVNFVLHDGEMTVMKGHEAMLAALEIGELRIKVDGNWKYAAASQGFIEVRPDQTLIFVQSCEWPEDIDAARAEELRQRALEDMRQKQSLIEYKESQAALARAMTRLHIKNHISD